MPRSKPSLAAGVRVMTLNLAHGRKLAFHQALLSRRRFAKNLRHVGDILRREAPDVVTLQEADGPSVWSGSFDHVDSLARYAGFDFILRGRHVAVGWPLVLDYGTAIVSRLPVNEEQSVRFAQAPYDTKGFVRATVLAPELGGLVDVVSVHLDFLSRGTRWRQVEILQRALVDRPHPLILAGDFNSEWQDTTCVAWLADVLDLVAWAPDAGEPTFPNRKPQARLDWILVSEDLRFDSYATLSDRVSDHRGVVARLSRKTPASSR
ncbi:MAG: endonuclease/exonuclease/phosphatase family protein [Deltaproteobacteria bacterium]|nr:endonuclease/exonuclease/phosphatase family protein [Deltaproteobacteria bacterium]